MLALTSLLLEPWLWKRRRKKRRSRVSCRPRFLRKAARHGERGAYADSEGILDCAQQAGLFLCVLVALVEDCVDVCACLVSFGVSRWLFPVPRQRRKQHEDRMGELTCEDLHVVGFGG